LHDLRRSIGHPQCLATAEPCLGISFTTISTGCGSTLDGATKVQGSGVNASVRLDHNTWLGNAGGCPMLTASNLFGVADHNAFTANAQMVPIAIFDFGGNGHGDDSWATADNMGSAQIFYFETNTITGNTGSYMVTDGWRGSRVVWRYNQFVNAGVGNHGTESSERDRGMRQMEVYENDFTMSAVTDSGGGLSSFRGRRGL
jgi:hypothetical protein